MLLFLLWISITNKLWKNNYFKLIYRKMRSYSIKYLPSYKFHYFSYPVQISAKPENSIHYICTVNGLLWLLHIHYIHTLRISENVLCYQQREFLFAFTNLFFMSLFSLFMLFLSGHFVRK